MTISTVDPVQAALELAREICDALLLHRNTPYFFIIAPRSRRRGRREGTTRSRNHRA